MKKTKIEITAGCEVEKTEVVDGSLVVTFKPKEQQPPKTWEEFCENNPKNLRECYIDFISRVIETTSCRRCSLKDKNILPDRKTAEAVLAFCQLIQLRNVYNGDWVPDWDDEEQEKYVITFVCCDEITITDCYNDAYSPLYFNNEKLAKEFLRNFRPLIEKLKPLYGIMEGGDACK